MIDANDSNTPKVGTGGLLVLTWPGLHEILFFKTNKKVCVCGGGEGSLKS